MTQTSQKESVLIAGLRIREMLSIVVIVGSVSPRLEKVKMSDGDEKSFSEQVEDIRERRQNLNQTESERTDSEEKEKKEIGESDKSFTQKIEKFQNGEREENPWEEVPKWKAFGGIIGIILAVVLSIMFSLSGNPALGAIFLSLPIIVPLVLTESGREFLRTVQEEMNDKNQVQQKSTQSKPKRICSDCGWQNPQENSYCHDCGSELGNSG